MLSQAWIEAVAAVSGVLDAHREAGLEGSPRMGGHVGRKGHALDETRTPTHPGLEKQVSLVGPQTQQLHMVDLHRICDAVGDFLEEFVPRHRWSGGHAGKVVEDVAVTSQHFILGPYVVRTSRRGHVVVRAREPQQHLAAGEVLVPGSLPSRLPACCSIGGDPSTSARRQPVALLCSGDRPTSPVDA